jgi:phosphate transport system substrate-binding protein
MRYGMVATALLWSCTAADGPGPQKTVLRVSGANSAGTLLPRLAAAFEKGHDVTVRLESGGGAQGFRDLLDKKTDLVVTSRRSLPAEREQAKVDGYSLEAGRTIAAVDVVAIAVHPSNPLQSLTHDHIIGIFCQRNIDDWSFLGLPSHPIQVVVPETTSGDRALFEDFFCGPRGISPRVPSKTVEEITKILAEDPHAISFSSTAIRPGKVLGVQVDNNTEAVFPSQQNILRGIYPLYQDIYLYTPGSAKGTAAEFLTFIASPAGQEIVDEAGYVPLFLRPKALDTARPLRETIQFDEKSGEPNQRSMARLQLLEDELKERAGEYRHVILEGYTDDREPESIALSEQRAETVKGLLSKSMPGLYFEIIPRGASQPLAPNETPLGRSRNRRVQIYLADEEKGPQDVAVPEAPQ